MAMNTVTRTADIAGSRKDPCTVNGRMLVLDSRPMAIGWCPYIFLSSCESS
jgi:hypothetical protein